MTHRNERYLVTGGAGFIGSHLVDKLIADGKQVMVLDDFSTGKEDNLNAAAEVVCGDVADADLVNKLMAQVDGCYHLAAIASVQQANQNWLGTHRANLTGTITVFNAARATDKRATCPVVYASSAAVYGDIQSSQPLVEKMHVKPLTAYGADKYACELHAFIASKVHKIATTGLRFFNVYGPRQDPSSPYSGVISIFFDRIQTQKKLTIFGGGEQSRDFIYVTDVVNHLYAAMHSLMQAPTVEASVYNVCTGVATSINTLVNLITDTCKQSPNIQYAAERLGDIRQSLGNPNQAKQHLKVQANINLAQGLAQLIHLN